MSAVKKIITAYNKVSLVLRILIGLTLGVILGLLVPGQAWIDTIGDLFVGALKGIAPVLVFVLVISSLAGGTARMDKRFGIVVFLYLLSTFLAAFVAVCVSFIFPQSITLTEAYQADSVVSGIGEVLKDLLLRMFQNPIESIAEGQYVGILVWAILFGLAMKKFASPETKKVIADLTQTVTTVVRWIINLAPFGIMGLVFSSISETGLEIFSEYGSLLLILVGCMLCIALVVDPLVSFILLHRNP